MKLPSLVFATCALGIALPTIAAPTPSDIRDGQRFEDVCNISDRHILFDYKSSEVDDEQNAALGEAAWCLTAGPLSGEDVILMGHAGPKGDRQGNYALALERAQTVKDELVKMGVEAMNIEVISVGEDHENLYEDKTMTRRVSIVRNFSTDNDAN